MTVRCALPEYLPGICPRSANFPPWDEVFRQSAFFFSRALPRTVLHTIASVDLDGVEGKSSGARKRKVQFLKSAGWRQSCSRGHNDLDSLADRSTDKVVALNPLFLHALWG